MAKRALINGITGQDGSYLVELLLDKSYEPCRSLEFVTRNRAAAIKLGLAAELSLGNPRLGYAPDFVDAM